MVSAGGFLLLLISFLMAAKTARSAPLDHFVWSPVATPQTAAVPFGMTITATDASGNLVSNYSGNATVSGESLTGPGMVISEVDNGTTNQVELTNPSTNSVDVSSWTVAFYDVTKWPQPSRIFTIPAGTTSPPLSVFVIAAGGVAPGVFPNFQIGASLAWSRFSANPIAVTLLNQTKGLVDFFCASTAYPFLITNPVTILPSAWLGAPVAFNLNPSDTFQRQDDYNHQQAVDWVATNRSIGTLNSGLSLPFIADNESIAVLPSEISLTNGVWNGFLSIQTPGDNLILDVDDDAGHPGASNPFNVVASVGATLSLPTQTSDISPGIHQAAIVIPGIVGSNLVFSLMSEAPSKIGVPPSVIIPAGTTSNGFFVTNFNDSMLDGVQLVTITASNFLFPVLQGVVTNFSAPVSLTLTTPGEVNQQSGETSIQAELSTGIPVSSNFQAEVYSSDPNLLATPTFVQIPAGETNAAFSIGVAGGPQIVGSEEVTITALAAPDFPTSSTMTVFGLPASLTLQLPAQLIEGAGAVGNCTAAISGVLPTNLTITLTSSDPVAVEVPGTVVVPAGQTVVVFSLYVQPNSIPGPDLSVTISASAPGFTSTNATIEVLNDLIAQLPLQVNDLVFNPTNGKLYASVDGSSPVFGNSVVAIDPVSLQVSNPIYVGSEPGALALSPDGRYLYVYLQSSASIDLVDLQLDTVTFEDSIYPFSLTEMFVFPGGADTLVLSQNYTNMFPSEGGVLILVSNQASALADLPPVSLIQPSLLSNVFYAYDNARVPSSVTRVQVESTNTVNIVAGGLTLDGEPEIRSGGDLLFFSSGEVIDPEAMIHLATFPGLALPPSQTQPDNHICPDIASGRVYYLTLSGGTATISAYGLNNYQVTGTLQVSGISGTPEQLVRWGTSGFAFATSGGQLFSVQTPLVPTNQPADLAVTQSVPNPTNLGTNLSITLNVSNLGPGTATGVSVDDILPAGFTIASASTTQGTISINGGTLTGSLATLDAGASAQLSIFFEPSAVGLSSNYVRVAANEPDPVMTNNSSIQAVSIPFFQNTALYIGDLAYDPSNGMVFATVQSGFGYTNIVAEIDPSTGVVVQALPVAFTPGKIAITSDSQFLYVGTTQDAIVARINIQAWTNDLTFGLGIDPNGIGYIVGDFAPMPGQPHSVAVSMHTWYGSYSPQVAIFDDGVSRSKTLVEAGGGTYFIETSVDGSTLYVINDDGNIGYSVNGLTFSTDVVDGTGIEPATTYISGYSSDFRIQNNLLFTQAGQVLNLQNDTSIGNFPVAGLVSPDLTNGLVYYLVQGGQIATPNWTLYTCSSNITNISWQILIPGATGSAYSLTRCGSNIFAFATAATSQLSYQLIPTANELFFVNLSALPSEGDLVLAVTTNQPLAGSNLTNTFNILNDGIYNSTGIVFTNVLAGGTTFVSASSTQGTCSQTNGVVTCNVGAMAADSSVNITVVSRVPTPGTIPLLAFVSKNGPDLFTFNNQISSTETVYPDPSVTVSNVVVYRESGESGITATFQVHLVSAAPQPLSLYCYTVDGTAHSPTDYSGVTNGLAFPAGTTSANFSVTIRNSSLVESNLVFYLNVSLGSGFPPITQATCTVINYNFYSISTTNVSITAAASGVTNAIFNVRLSASNPLPASVEYFTQDGNAASGRDYLGKAGTLMFPPGTTNESILIPVFGIANSVPLKEFYLNLADSVNASLATTQVAASILSTNPPSPVIISGISASGGNVVLTFPSASGAFYRLESSTNLSASNWTAAINNILGTGASIILTDTNGVATASKFYRLVEMP